MFVVVLNPKSAWLRFTDHGLVLLAYLDESYKRGDSYWLGLCVVPEQRVEDMCRAMRSAAASVPVTFGLSSDVEMHAQHLYHGDGAFAPLKRPVKLRARVFRRGIDAVLGARARIFLVGVDWNEALAHQALATHRLAALRYLLDHLESYCELHGQRVLLIADEEETSASEVVAVTRDHQDRVRARAGCSRILDAPLFTPSHWSSGVQGADLVTFVNSRRRFGRSDGRPEDRRAQETLDAWWEAIEPQVEVRHCYGAPPEPDRVLVATTASRGPTTHEGPRNPRPFG